MKRLLGAFTEWFQSAGGVWQTTVAVLAVVVVELADRSLDPHAFVLMAVLTVYSAVTQPALAYGNARAAEQADTALERIEKVERHIEALLDHHGVER